MGPYDYDFRLNASLQYQANEHRRLNVYIQNLLGVNNNKRYAYDTGTSRAAPHRVRFVEEPRTFGLRLDYKF